MKILLIQCLRGKRIGEIEIEHINNEGCFYYNFKKELFKTKLEANIPVVLVQYKSIKKAGIIEKQCCGIAIGKYEELEIDNLDFEKNLLKIVKIRQIKFNKDQACKDEFKIEKSKIYKKIIEIIEEINPNVLSDVSHNLIKSEVEEDKFEELKQLVFDNDLGKEEGEIPKNIRDSYNRLEKNPCKVAQKSIYAKRVENKGDRRANRTEYQRDWERIIHSKSFRRLEDKAQIYTLAKGDHFRTRLTHTLEVAQIARGIARELNLNEDLVEAIALGHDLGHTPFGHAGERTLNNILKAEEVYGGFKHNFQGVKVVNYLEEKYGDFEGIDLTYQVMEGILKHTKICDCDKKDVCKGIEKEKGLMCPDNKYKIEKFLCKGDITKLHLEYNFSTTLEGQVVAVSDEIAQRAHDLDDGIASGIINEEEFLEDLENDEVFRELKEKIDESLNYINDDKRDYIDKSDIKRARIISDIITYFIKKIVDKSRPIIEEMEKQIGGTDEKTEFFIYEEIIKFYDEIEIVRDRLDHITSKKVIGSEGVKSFDEKGEYIIKELYRAYFEDPIKRMPENTLKRISREISKHMNDTIDISLGKKKLDDISQDIKELIDKETQIYKGEGELNEINSIKHKIFVRSIVDFISGMTDEFAVKQFKEIYLPITY